ncbi:MAG: hypothetical protein V8Q86_00285 [Blautia sp.]
MEPESSKEAGTAARATEGFDSPVKTETVAVSDIEVSSEKSSKNDRPIRKKRNYLRLGKVAGVAGVCLLCVFAASMTSEANRNYFIRGFKYLTGNDTKVIVGNDEENEDVNIDEYEAIEDIENKIGVEVPEFYYRPQGMKFYDYIIRKNLQLLRIEYQYRDTILMFILISRMNILQVIYILLREKRIRIDTMEDGVKITIKEIRDKEEVPTLYGSLDKK